MVPPELLAKVRQIEIKTNRLIHFFLVRIMSIKKFMYTYLISLFS